MFSVIKELLTHYGNLGKYKYLEGEKGLTDIPSTKRQQHEQFCLLPANPFSMHKLIFT